MSWNQLKAPLVAAAAILATILVFVLGIKAIRSARESHHPSLQGAWQGTLDTGPTKLRLVLKVSKTHDGWHATMDSIDQGAKDIPVSAVEYKYPNLRIEVERVHGTFEGTLNAAGTEMNGNWNQGRPMPLVLKRTATPDTIPDQLTESEYAPRAGSDVQGYWRGTLVVKQHGKEMELRVGMRIAEAKDGTLRVEGESVDQGAKSIPASSATYRAPTLTVEFAAVGASLRGTVNPVDKTIVATTTQGSETLPITFKLSDPHADKEQQSKWDYTHDGPNDLPGHWRGTLDIPKAKMKLRLALDVGKAPDGKLAAKVISLDQGNAEIPATVVEFAAPTVHLEWKALNASYYGKLEEGKISGAWRQGGALTLVFERDETK